MLLSLDEVEKAIPPLELVARLRLPYEHQQGGVVITCPYCRSQAWVLKTTVLCQNQDCSMQAGGVMEIALSATPGKKYPEAAALLQKLYARRLEQMPAYDGPEFARVISSQARSRRRMMQFVRDTQASTDVSSSRAAMLASFQKQGMLNPGGVLVGVLGASDQPRLLEIITELGLIEFADLPARDLLCSFYWSDWHVPVAAVLMDPVKKWQRRIDFRNYGLAVCGLHLLTPIVKTVHLHTSPFEAGCKNTQWQRQDTQCASVAFLLGEDDTSLDFIQDHQVLHWDNNALLPVSTRLHSMLPSLNFCVNGSDRQLSYVDFLFRTLTPHLKEGVLTKAGLNLVGQINPTGEVKAVLIDKLRSMHAVKAAEQLKSDLYNILIAQSDKVSVYATPAGYACRKRTRPMEPVSNFTLHPAAHVSFGPHLTPHLEVDVRLGSYSTRLLLPPRMLDNTKDLQSTLSLRMAAQRGTAYVAPIVADTKAFGAAMDYVKSRTAQLPLVVGLPFLGWAFDKSQFYAPGLFVSADAGTHSTSMPFNPEASLLDSYGPKAVAENETAPETLAPDTQRLMLLLIGSIIRASRNEMHRPVTYAHDSRSQALFAACFNGLGQLRPVQTQQISHEYVHGYPVWLQHARRDNRDHAAVFTLQPAGDKVTEHGDLTRVPGVMRRLLRTTVESILSTPMDWEAPRGVTYTNMLLIEAASFARRHLGWNVQLPINGYDWIEHLLHQHTAGTISKLASYDFTRQVVTWKLDAHTRNPDDLMSVEYELRSLMDDVSVNQGNIETPAEATIDMLSLYYGAPPHFDVAAPTQ